MHIPWVWWMKYPKACFFVPHEKLPQAPNSENKKYLFNIFILSYFSYLYNYFLPRIAGFFFYYYYLLTTRETGCLGRPWDVIGLAGDGGQMGQKAESRWGLWEERREKKKYLVGKLRDIRGAGPGKKVEESEMEDSQALGITFLLERGALTCGFHEFSIHVFWSHRVSCILLVV